MDNHSIDPGAGVATSYVFNLASLFDPDHSGTGHQPLNFDNYAAMYNNYCVLTTVAKVTCFKTGTSSTTDETFLATLVSRDPSPSFDSLHALNEAKGVKVKLMNPASGTHPPNTVITNKCDLGKWLTVPWTNSERYAAVTATPSRNVYWIVWAGPSDFASNPAAVSVRIELFYDAIFFDPKMDTTQD